MRSKRVLSCISSGLLLLTLTSVDYRHISEQKAIELAEQFIRYNGYTGTPVDTLKHKLSYELFDGHYTYAALIAKRHNSLRPKAYFISKSDERYDVGFISTSVKESCATGETIDSALRGKAVIVSADGGKIRMEHKSPFFLYFRRVSQH